MPLPSGARLGPYEIVGLLGVGGMGEVYRAKDARLGREVAIKVLPATYSSDANRLNRFQHEARAASALNHPNILAIYDIGTQDGSPYLVSELLEGETLRHKVGSLSSRKAVEYASQIARGLGAAHEKGIVHRDLKPENLFITKDGHVKILDFGLAKLIQPEVAASKMTEAPTASRQTEPGVVMGTVGYMSPEQVRAESVDHRSDVFTLGAILYEILSGKRPFAGSSGIEVMNAILKEEPADLSESNSSISPGLSRVVNRCMEKDPRQRFQSARDLSFALEAVSGSSESRAASLGAARKPRSFRELLTLLAAIAFAALALFFGIGYFHRSPEPQRILRASIVAPSGYSFNGASLSPDGNQLAFLAQNKEQQVHLWVQSLENGSTKQLVRFETFTPYQPIWSPDSRFIAFFADGKLKKILATGGSEQTICDAEEPRGGTWSQNGTILLARGPEEGLSSVSSDGGTPVQVTHVDRAKHEVSHRFPSFLPDGRHFLFFKVADEKQQGIFVGSLDGGETKLVLNNETRGLFANNELLFVREGALMAQSFDLNRLSLSGSAKVIADKVLFTNILRLSAFSVSANGQLIYVTRPLQQTRVIWQDRQAMKNGEFPGLGNVNGANFSHDGRRILVSRLDEISQAEDLWIYDAERASSTRSTFTPGQYFNAVWSRDDKQYLFARYKSGSTQILRKLSDSSSEERLILEAPYFVSPNDWSPDGQFMIFQRRDPETGMDLMVLRLADKAKPSPFVQTPFNEGQAQFSPDGKWVAFRSDKSGRGEIYVRPFENPEGNEWQVSTSGGNSPTWRNDGQELLYINQGKVMSAAIKPGTTFQAEIPRPIYTIPPNVDDVIPFPDGQRFLLTITTEDPDASRVLTLVDNWPALLKQ
ncbi:MAG TPA: protein kinase [Acidobacteriota bacterium]|nr:protein kinase [Acidobacteriota bacterium]